MWVRVDVCAFHLHTIPIFIGIDATAMCRFANHDPAIRILTIKILCKKSVIIIGNFIGYFHE